MIPQTHHMSMRMLQRCPSCQQQLAAESINVIQETTQSMTAHIACLLCHVSYVTYFIANPQGIVGNAMITDLSFSELIAALRRQVLSADDFLHIFNLIKRESFIAEVKKSLSISHLHS